MKTSNGIIKTAPHYNAEEVAWKFNKLLLETDPESRFYIELGETVRIRCVECVFNDSGPTEPPKNIMQTEMAVQNASSQAVGAIPFTVVVSCG